MAVPVPAWKLNEEFSENGAVEDTAFAAEPVVLVVALTVENTGCRLSAEAELVVVFVEVEAPAEVPVLSCTLALPEATVEPAVAVVSAAARAEPAERATNAAARRSFFIV